MKNSTRNISTIINICDECFLVILFVNAWLNVLLVTQCVDVFLQGTLLWPWHRTVALTQHCLCSSDQIPQLSCHCSASQWWINRFVCVFFKLLFLLIHINALYVSFFLLLLLFLKRLFGLHHLLVLHILFPQALNEVECPDDCCDEDNSPDGSPDCNVIRR